MFQDMVTSAEVGHDHDHHDGGHVQGQGEDIKNTDPDQGIVQEEGDLVRQWKTETGKCHQGSVEQHKKALARRMLLVTVTLETMTEGLLQVTTESLVKFMKNPQDRNRCHHCRDEDIRVYIKFLYYICSLVLYL